LAPAEAAGLVRVEVGGIAFRHPLVRSLAYATTNPVARRDAHAALAAALPDEADRDRRAWHLAAAATEPDEELALLLEQTADRAEARGGHAAASRALERAARLSLDGDAAARRLTRAARLAFWSGEPEHAHELVDDALEATADRNLRAEAVLERESIRGAQMAGYAGALQLAPELEHLDPDTATRTLLNLVSERSGAFDAAGAAGLSERLEGIARRAGPWWRPRGLLIAATAYLAIARLDDFERLLAEVVHEDAVVANHALDMIWAERYELTRSVLDSTLREGRAAGNEMRVIWNQAALAHLELRLGRLHHVLPAVAESVTLADARGVLNWAGIARGALAGVHAWRGEEDACRTTAAQSLVTASEAHSVSDELSVRSVLGLLALSLGRHEAVVEELAPAEELWTSSTHVEPSAVPFVPDLVEARAHLGDVDEARASLERFRDAAERARRQWALAAVARCEGLLAPADGYADFFDRALGLLESSPLALDRARTQLLYGERLRRAGQRREARGQLRAAHEAFSAVDAAPWAERAAAELRATGESVGPRTPDRRAQLSPQERQIAQLVGEGKTNKEIAAQLYLSPKTIEYHLGNAYRKLDIHSRAELTRIILER
jgi:DNA-binding CsgD family transcriptional regulator